MLTLQASCFETEASLLHWLIARAILAEFALGVLATNVGKVGWAAALLRLHVPLGPSTLPRSAHVVGALLLASAIGFNLTAIAFHQSVRRDRPLARMGQGGGGL